MILSSFKRKPINLFVIIIFAIALFLRLYKIADAFPFDFDQEVPAFAAYNFFVNHKISLIGQEISFPGLFTGPFHNWIQFIPYGACHLFPDCVPYFYIAIGLFSLVILFFVIRRILGNKVAVIASIIYGLSFNAITFERGVNSNYFLFMTSIALLFCMKKYFSGERKYFLIGSFLAGLAFVNANPVFILSTIAFFVTSFLRGKSDLKIFFLGILFFSVNFAPILVFNFRHDNLIFHSIKNFVLQNTTVSNYFERAFFLAKDILLPFYTNYLFNSVNIFLQILVLFILIFGTYKIYRCHEKFLYYLPLWILMNYVGLLFYRGHIPDYYFQQSILPFILIVSLVLAQKLYVFLTILAFFLFLNFYSAYAYHSVINYSLKKEAVKYVIENTGNVPFMVYYDLPKGLNTGYSYLFKAFGKEPVDKSPNLYIINFSNFADFNPFIYYKSFPNKSINFKSIGFIQVVSVK